MNLAKEQDEYKAEAARLLQQCNEYSKAVDLGHTEIRTYINQHCDTNEELQREKEKLEQTEASLESQISTSKARADLAQQQELKQDIETENNQLKDTTACTDSNTCNS